MAGRSDGSLTELLQEYADRLRTLPVPNPPRELTPLERSIVDLGNCVADRLGPGLTSEELDAFEASLGVGFPPQLREWYRWANGHLPGVFDEDNSSANLFPFGRQMDTTAGARELKHTLEGLRMEAPPIPQSPVVVLHGESRTFMVDCESEKGAVWLFDVPDLLEPIFESLAGMVSNSIELLRLGLIHLDFIGAAELVRPEELAVRGIAFESDWEEFRYLSYGCIPSAFRG